MFTSISARSANAYKRVSVESSVSDASPHKLVEMLFEGLLSNVGSAAAALERGDIKTGQSAAEVSGAPGQWLTVGELSTSQEGQGAALSNPSQIGVASGSERQTLQIRVTRQ